MANPKPTVFQELLTGYLTDQLSAEQEQSFFEQLLQPGNQAALGTAIDSMAGEMSDSIPHAEQLRARSLQLLQQRIGQPGNENLSQHASPASIPGPPAPVRKMQWTKWVAAAAVLLLIASGAWFFFQQNAGRSKDIAATRDTVNDDLEPGKNGAILVLADGRKILLDSVQNGMVAQQNNTQLTLSNGQLSYHTNSQTEQPAGYNTVTTPIGRQIQLSLPDGTRAWLNAGSSLHFPTAFSGSNRTVTMTGEVFFEIERDAAKPFIVKTGAGTNIEVLGTSFNINAYDNEPSINTTLAEGSVKLSHDNRSVLLKPGQQGVIIPGQATAIDVLAVDVSEIIAWKEGRFELYGNIKNIMRQLQRWYNISEVQYSGGTESRKLVATISRSKKLSEVLAILEKTGTVHFSIEGEKVIVKP